MQQSLTVAKNQVTVTGPSTSFLKLTECPWRFNFVRHLQHLWAELSEKLSDLRDPSIKYGGGPRAWQIHLQKLSGLSSIVEDYQLLLSKLGEFTESHGPHQVLDLGSFEANRQQLQNNISEFIAFWLSMPDIREESEWAKIEALVLASYQNPKRTNDQDN